MIVVASAQLLELLVATLNVGDETLGEGAVLNIGQDALHALLGIGVDDAWAGDIATELRGVRDGVVHVLDAALENEVDDQLQLVQALEVSHLRLVARLNQNLEAGLDELLGATAQDGLLTEEVGNGLRLEGGRNDACASTANGCSVGQSQVATVTLRVLVDGDQTRNTLTVDVLTAHQVAWPLRCDHADGDVVLWLDHAKVDVQAVAEEQGVAVLQVRSDVIFVDLRLGGIRGEQHDDVGPLAGLGVVQNLEASLFSLLARLGALAQANGNLYTRLAKVLRVSVPLGAVANDRNLATLDDRQVSVVVVKNINCHEVSTFLASRVCPRLAIDEHVESITEISLFEMKFTIL